MNDSEANEIRLVANEIMRRLYVEGQREQLDLLRMYAVSAIEHIDNQKRPLSRSINRPGEVQTERKHLTKLFW